MLSDNQINIVKYDTVSSQNCQHDNSRNFHKFTSMYFVSLLCREAPLKYCGHFIRPVAIHFLPRHARGARWGPIVNISTWKYIKSSLNRDACIRRLLRGTRSCADLGPLNSELGDTRHGEKKKEWERKRERKREEKAQVRVRYKYTEEAESLSGQNPSNKKEGDSGGYRRRK